MTSLLLLLAACHRPSAPRNDRNDERAARPVASSTAPAVPPSTSFASDHAIEAIPASVSDALVGCWQTAGDVEPERWEFRRAGAGLEVVRRVAPQVRRAEPDYARRAALASRVRFLDRTSELGFETAGPRHAALFVFRLESGRIIGNWASRRAPTEEYHVLAGRSTLERCR